MNYIKTPGLNNLEPCVITYNSFITYMVLVFSDLKKAQIYKTLYTDSRHHEIEIVLSCNYLNLFKPNEHTVDYYIRKPNDEFSQIEIEDKNYIYVGEKVITFETNDIIVKYSLDIGLSDMKFPYAYGEEYIYFMLHQKYIPTQEYETSTLKNEYEYLNTKDDKVKGDDITDENGGNIEYGNNFIKCKIIQCKQ